MTKLDEHISKVERYGLVREQFPLEYNGHRITILCNDAYKTNDERLLFDFTLYCKRCKLEGGISGRFPASDDEQTVHVCNARVAVFDRFNRTECES